MKNTGVAHSSVIRGILYGNMSALIASALFAGIDSIGVAINSLRLGISQSFDFHFSWFVFIMGLILSVVPATVGGSFLAWKLSQDYQKDRLSHKSAFIDGALIGGSSGFAICSVIVFLVVMLILLTGHGNFWVFIERSVEVIFLSALAGGFTSQNVAAFILKRDVMHNKIVIE
jgi:hypothetical protein